MKYIYPTLILFCFVSGAFAQERVVNYDEAKVGDYTLPNVLKTSGNKEVATVRDWENIRRSEILQLFEDEVYGEMPVQYDKLEFSTINADDKAMDGKASMKE